MSDYSVSSEEENDEGVREEVEEEQQLDGEKVVLTHSDERRHEE